MTGFDEGSVIAGRYRIVRLIGDGGMGRVYEARHELLGTPVAVKLLHAELARRPRLVERFLREARVSASIHSPHVTRVTDVERTPDGNAFLVMELLSGQSLQQLRAEAPRLPVGLALDISIQILSGLEAAHALGVVHRDLKPDNVFVTPTPTGPVVKLLDFGIAKLRQASDAEAGLTRPGAMLGTPEYMAPEQALAADRVDARADIYSLGAILYELLSGRRPAEGEDLATIISQVRGHRVPQLDALEPELPHGLGAVVHRAIAPEPLDRFQTAFEMRQALLPFVSALSQAGHAAALAPMSAPGAPLLATPEPASTRPLQTPASPLSSQHPLPLPAPWANPSSSGATCLGPVAPMSLPRANPAQTPNAGIPARDAGALRAGLPLGAPLRAPATEAMPLPPLGAVVEQRAPRPLPLGLITLAVLFVGAAAGTAAYALRGPSQESGVASASASGSRDAGGPAVDGTLDAPATALVELAAPEPLVAREPVDAPAPLATSEPEAPASKPAPPRAARRPAPAAAPVAASEPAGSAAPPRETEPTASVEARNGEIRIRFPEAALPKALPPLPAALPDGLPAGLPSLDDLGVGSDILPTRARPVLHKPPARTAPSEARPAPADTEPPGETPRHL